MNDISVPPTLEPEVYQHYKGKRYQVISVGCHTETHEYYVVYRPLYDHEGQPDVWLRPYDMFVSSVEVDGVAVPRFSKMN